MKITILDYKTNEEITNFTVRKNAKISTIFDKTKEQLKVVFNYPSEVKMLPTGSINLATGEKDIHYIVFGLQKDIKIIKEWI